MALSLRLRRVGFRFAYRILRVLWYVRRPRVLGVKCLLTTGDCVLLVRHTYGPAVWDLPGGVVKRGEPPLSTARREMHEELGIENVDWSPAGTVRGRQNYRHDEIHCFRAELADAGVAPNLTELAAVRWFDASTLPGDLGFYVRPVLVGAGVA